MAVQMQVRRGTAAAWVAANPTLLSGEIGYETDTRQAKVGDGVTVWTSLGYLTQGVGGPPGSFAGPSWPDDDGYSDPTSFLPSTPVPQREFLIKPAVLTANTANQTSTTEAIISQVFTVPAGFSRIGTTFEVELHFSAAAGAVAQTTPGIVFRLRWGGLAGVIIATTGIITPATVLAASGGYARGLVTVRTLGGSGSIMASLAVEDPRSDRSVSNALSGTLRTMVPAAAVAVDTTTSKDLVLTSVGTAADAALITFGVVGISQIAAY